MIRESEIIMQLQKHVAIKFGKQIGSATDCENLAKVLDQSQNSAISAQTLRRFFGLINVSSKSSFFTLDLLSKYCGFRGFRHFRDSVSNRELETFFGAAEDSGHDFWRKSEQLCREIAMSSDLLVTTNYRLMSFPLVRKYFMENHPMRDMLGTLYSQYFMSYLKFNPTNEARIFAYGFLFQSAFLQGNHELMKLFYHKIKQTELTPEVHLIPAGLKFGITLLYADFIGDEILFNETYSAMIAGREQYISASRSSVCSFEYTVLESLIFTDRKTEIQFLLDHNTFQTSIQEDFIPEDRKMTHAEVWKILCAVGYHKTDDSVKAQKYLNEVNLENLGFGWKKYYSIIYYFVLLHYSDSKVKQKITAELHHLIIETRLTFFGEKLEAYHLTGSTKLRRKKSKPISMEMNNSI